MSTRSIVAKPDGNGSWKGRYVHWDGYPEGRLPVLDLLIKRDGLDKVIETIIDKHYGWSHLDPSNDELELGRGYDDGRFQVVPGYGVAYTTEQGQSDPDEWYDPSNVIDSWCEYVYVLTPDGVQALSIGEGQLDRISYTMTSDREVTWNVTEFA